MRANIVLSIAKQRQGVFQLPPSHEGEHVSDTVVKCYFPISTPALA